LTSIPSSTEGKEEYPEWHPFDCLKGIDARQVSDDDFQIRTESSIMTLRKEGFDLYCAGDMAEFDNWRVANPDLFNIKTRDSLD
jgi:hypothetical protein